MTRFRQQIDRLLFSIYNMNMELSNFKKRVVCNILKESRWTQDRNTAVVNDWEYKHILLMFDDNLHIVLL